MNRIESSKIDCPCCGEQIELLIYCSIEHQEYIEDCPVCCHPNIIEVELDGDGSVRVSGRAE